jgi:hypothetical protein
MSNRAAVRAGIVCALALAGAAAQERPDALASLVAAERAFARMSVETSQRDAFLANFADEGVWFVPAPSNTRADLRKAPVPPGPPQQVLDWEPWTGDVAASGDLGYTTGPWAKRALTGEPDRRLLDTGWFFSVWEWRADQGWKVLADFGISAPHDGALRALSFQRARVRGAAPPSSEGAGALGVQLRAADVELARQVTDKGWSAALSGMGTADVRVYRDRRPPAAGRDAAARLLPSGSVELRVEPTFARASSAGDLGVTYGAYQSSAERGYYVHVWKRLGTGWTLAADVSNVAPPAQR